MALKENAIRCGFATHLANLATNTTLGTATRHDFAAITLPIPEVTSRDFLSVQLVVTIRDAFTAATSFTGFRLGIKLGAVAFDDVDYANAQGNSGDHETVTLVRDVTSYFDTNFGSGATQTCQVGVAVSTAAASNVNNITAHLLIAYEFDDAGATTRVKTIGIPIQSHHTFLGTAHVEVGTTGGVVNAPANQIPALDTYLVESSKTYSATSYIEVWAQDWSGGFTTDITPFYQIDSTTEVQRATLEQALGAATYFHDIFPWDTSTHLPNAVHAFKARADVDQRMVGLGAVLWVTYTYTASSTAITNQALVPLLNQADSQVPLYPNGNGTAGDANLYRIPIDVQEPATVALVQSAVVMMTSISATTSAIVAAGSQSERTYSLPSNVPYAGPFPFVHRGDHSTGWTLARGKNTLLFKIRQSTETRAHFQAFALLTWTSGASALGVSAHTKTATYYIADMNTTAAAARDQVAANTRTPKINDTNYVLQGSTFDVYFRAALAFAPVGFWAKILSGEWDQAGYAVMSATLTSSAELNNHHLHFAGTPIFNGRSNATGKANIESSRGYRFESVANVTFQALHHVAYHTITYAVSGTVSNAAGDGSGITVDIFRVDTDEKVNSATTAVGGGFSSVVFDDTVNHYAVAREDATHLGRSNDVSVPSTTMHIVFASGAGADTATGSRFNRGIN